MKQNDQTSAKSALFVFLFIAATCALSYGMSLRERTKHKEEIKKMFYHAYDSYMLNAFPMDELSPLSCTGRQSWFSQALTLIDALDTLVLIGNQTEFKKQVNWVIKNLNFNRDVHVSVFETNIRILGGLLSAHLLIHKPRVTKLEKKYVEMGNEFLSSAPPTAASAFSQSEAVKLEGTQEPVQYSKVQMPEYNGELLLLAKDLADRLLPAFNTKTGIPFGMINLKTATVSPNESILTSTAGGGTHLVEFGILSALLNDTKYYDTANKAMKYFYESKSNLGILGNHINIQTGQWTHRDAGVGASIDSYYEYLLKGYLLFGTEQHLEMFKSFYDSIMNNGIYRRPWYVDIDMMTGALTWPLYSSLQGFWPGLISQHEYFYNKAKETVMAFHSVWRRYGCVPEGFNLHSGTVQAGQKGYPLRPELAESIYFLYRISKDPMFLYMGRDIVRSLNYLTKVECGFANILDVETKALDDRMESFFLAETLKYLYLLFDEDNFVNTESFTFNTEGHILPVDKLFLTLGTLYKNQTNVMSFDEAQCRIVEEDAERNKLHEYFSELSVCELAYDPSTTI